MEVLVEDWACTVRIQDLFPSRGELMDVAVIPLHLRLTRCGWKRETRDGDRSERGQSVLNENRILNNLFYRQATSICYN